MRRITRRRLLMLAGAGLVGLGGVRYGLLPFLLRPSNESELGDEATAFVEACFAGIDRSKMWDTHAHVVGLGAGGTGCWINPEMQSHLHPLKRLQFDVYTNSLGMQDEATADSEYLARLLRLHRQANPSGKLLLLAFDLHVDPDGTERPERSSFHTPNEYVLRIAAENADVLPGVSIHPYRKDAVDRLVAAASRGARAVKWLPGAMGIDPASPACDVFYRQLAELDLPLITHGGHEYAVDALSAQELGNPLRLRRALDAGVRVVVAHCASLGSALDLDAPEGRRGQVRAFDLLVRLLGESRYVTSLFADISALTQLNRGGRALRRILRDEELHGRLVNGSDYPMPALRILFSPRALELTGLIDERSVRLCNEIAQVNPLLFDFALKRSLRLEKDGRVHRFADRVFETAWLFRETPPRA